MRKLALLVTAVAVAIVPAAFMSQAQASSRYAVTIKTSTASVNQGGTAVISGKVSPTAKGSTVWIQWYDRDQGGNRWRTATTATVSSSGTYSKTITPVDGTVDYRVYKPSGSGLSGGTSKTLVIRAYGWYSLASRVDAFNGIQYRNQYGPQTVAGVPVSDYWSSTETAGGVSRWGTHHSCNLLRLNIGLDDRSAAGAWAQFRVQADSETIVSVRLRKESLTAVEVPIDRAETAYLRFSAEAHNAVVPVYVNASRPRVHCAWPEDD
jgi:hypothetical protein